MRVCTITPPSQGDSCLSTKLLTLGIARASTALLSLNRNSPLSLRAEEEKYTTCKEYVLMFLCLNKLLLVSEKSFIWIGKDLTRWYMSI